MVTVVRDTVRITEPRYVRSVEVRTVEVEVPVQAGADTAVVALPIESREFCGDDYRAWVSGWQPSLDSLVITRTLARTEYTVSPTAKPRRWSVGLQAGVGMTPGGVQPYVGVGLSYRLTP